MTDSLVITGVQGPADRTRGLAVDHARLLLRLLDPLHRVDDPFDTTTIHQPSTES